jgi:hypothetical protein
MVLYTVCGKTTTAVGLISQPWDIVVCYGSACVYFHRKWLCRGLLTACGEFDSMLNSQCLW